MTLLEIPDDFGQGGANIGDGEVRLVDILKNHSEEIEALDVGGSVDNVARAAAATAQTTANGAVTVNTTQTTNITTAQTTANNAASAASAAQSDADAAQTDATQALADAAAAQATADAAAPLSAPVFSSTVQVTTGLSSWGHSPPPSQPVAGPATAGMVYGATEQAMIQAVYDALRGDGTIS